mmetsp:Transcript_1624/g.7546  ORF Transcript_1624/g.7546 Transcript_1624/m.7546 type:complete len:105 (-) Transcript_1624:1734-2048(-)
MHVIDEQLQQRDEDEKRGPRDGLGALLPCRGVIRAAHGGGLEVAWWHDRRRRGAGDRATCSRVPGAPCSGTDHSKSRQLLDKTLMNMRDEAQCARRDWGYDGRR